MDKPFVKVIWQDAADAEHTWISEDGAKEFGNETVEVISWGWQVSKTAKYITIAADYVTGASTFGRVTKIPLKMCTKIEEFKQE